MLHKIPGLISGVVSVMVAMSLPVSAQAEYPTKPVTLVIPYGPGGAADLAARIISATVPGLLGNGVLVVNRTGAAGVTGSTFVAKSRPDGYTLLLSRVGSQAAVPAINRKIPYKWDDFSFLGLTEQNPFVLAISANAPYKNFEQVKAAIKSGKKLGYSSAGVGTLLHLAMVILGDDLGAGAKTLKHIPYKGGGKAAAAVVGWSGIWGPQNLPEEVTDKWVEILQKLDKDKAWNKMTKSLGSIPTIMSPADTKAFVKKQYETFKEVTERLGLTIK